ncbi:Ubiquitin-specific protease incomplete domain containing protein [Pandoravirus salinus]|uniref:Ubiquitin-specific protease incomplete domain containing protein n=1 Tax=Pandoravirus salinus TaxID=1349410 RepID=S4VWM2_9VIRU|nr:Ubiquitin-specific protease incomplete domain [Pandoravirus salinus]AGO85044.2 Ubiquitin-specific protease incomplete domain containing protein [Pandoravirus salinus]
MDNGTQDSMTDRGAPTHAHATCAPTLPPTVTLDARGTQMTTTRTTLANAPLCSLLHRIAAPTTAGPFSAPTCQADGSYFVDINPRWLSVVIDYLAHGIVTAPQLTPGVLAGVQAVADYLGLDALSLECAARLARVEADDAPPAHRIKVYLVTATDLHAHTGALDVFSRHRHRGSHSSFTIALLRHHPVHIAHHIICQTLGHAPGDAVFYGCWMRRNTTLRPLAPLDMTASTPLSDGWAECDREMWLYVVKRKPPVDLVPVAPCGPSIHRAPTHADVPMLVFVKVFDPANRYLSMPRQFFVMPGATVASALPALLDIFSNNTHTIGDDDAVVYEEATNTTAYRLDLEGTFAGAEIETGDILWLCSRTADFGDRIAMADYDWIATPDGPRW